MESPETGESLISMARSWDAWSDLVSVCLVLTLTLAPSTGLTGFTPGFTYQSTVRSLSPEHNVECRALVTQPGPDQPSHGKCRTLNEPFHGDFCLKDHMQSGTACWASTATMQSPESQSWKVRLLLEFSSCVHVSANAGALFLLCRLRVSLQA